MRDQSYFNLVAGLAVVLVLVGGLASIVLTPAATGSARSATGSPSGATVYRNLTISFDPSTGSYSYNTAQLNVPLGVRVVFTITNFDTGSAVLPAAADAQVVGTYGGGMTVTSAGGSVTVTQLPTGEVSHTFSMSNSAYQLNVPIPRASGPGAPVTVTFAKVFTTPGTFQWGCVVLCGPSDMRTADSMFGSLTVS